MYARKIKYRRPRCLYRWASLGGQYSQHLAEAAGLSTEMVFLSSLGGFLHDIGKISIPDVILGKRGKLTELEYEVVKNQRRIVGTSERGGLGGLPDLRSGDHCFPECQGRRHRLLPRMRKSTICIAIQLCLK